MTDQMIRAQQIQDAMHTAGWVHIAEIFEREASEAEQELYEIMAKKPDSLTGKTALKYAIRARAIRDVIEILKDEVRLLPENQR